MDIEIRRRREEFHLSCRKQKAKQNHVETKRRILHSNSTFESIKNYVEAGNYLYILLLAEGIRLHQIALQMTFRDQYWLVNFTVSTESADMKVALFKLLLALKIKFNYLSKLAQVIWEEVEIIEYICYYASDVTVINLREPEFISLLVRKSMLEHPQFNLDYLETISRLFSCLTNYQKQTILPFVDQSIVQCQLKTQIKGLEVLLSICQSECISTSKLASLDNFNHVVHKALEDPRKSSSNLAFSIIKSILQRQEQEIQVILRYFPIVQCLQVRLIDSDTTIRQEAEEGISYLASLVTNIETVARLTRDITSRYQNGNCRTKSHITTCLNNLLAEPSYEVLNYLSSSVPQSLTIVLRGLEAKNTQIIESSLLSLLNISHSPFRAALASLEIRNSLEDLLEFPVSRIALQAQRLMSTIE